MGTLSKDDLIKIIEFLSEGVYVVDKHGVTMLVNSAYEKLSGLKREQLIGKHMAELEEEGIINESVSLKVLKEKKQLNLLQKINDKVEVTVIGSPVFDDNGEIQMIVTIVTDVTKLNSASRKLRKAESMLELQSNGYMVKQKQFDHQLIFKSKKMRELYQLIVQVAPYPTSILITGPTGSGKEVIANTIHVLSEQREGPFIKVNCGAIPENLMESEFFGYEPGSFTGAKKEGKLGLLELAHGGTLLLDEIGEMPMNLQVKLLRVLQEKKVQRMGSAVSRDANFRLISSTNKNLPMLISENLFREDLYYRIAVLKMEIPPLAERKEDVEELIKTFIEYYCDKYRIEKTITEEAYQTLVQYNWPGNVRELKNSIENLIVSIPGNTIESSQLPSHFFLNDDSPANLKQMVARYETKILKETLSRNQSIRKAAKELGVHHTTLLKKMQLYNIETKDALFIK